MGRRQRVKNAGIDQNSDGHLPTDSREQILEAAVTLFFEHGYEGTSVKSIAEKVDLSTPALYWHFESKRDLFYTAIEQLLHEFLDSVNAEITSEDPVERLRQIARAHVRWQLERSEHAGAYASTFGFRGLVQKLPAKHRRRVVGAERGYVEKVRDTLAEGKRQGKFKFEDLKVTAFALITLFEFTHSWFNPEGELTASDVAELYSDLALRMVGVEP